MASYNEDEWNANKKTATVHFDLAFRTEADMPEDFPMGDDQQDLEVYWERPNLLFDNNRPGEGRNPWPDQGQGQGPHVGVVQGHGRDLNAGPGPGCHVDCDDGYESETEPAITAYIKDFNRRKKKGGMVNGEYIYYDESMCCVRNIHNSSHSLTQYGSVNHDDFGRRKVMRPLLTPDERLMLGVPAPERQNPVVNVANPVASTPLVSTSTVSTPFASTSLATTPFASVQHVCSVVPRPMQPVPPLQLPPDISAVQNLVPALQKIFISSPNVRRRNLEGK